MFPARFWEDHHPLCHGVHAVIYRSGELNVQPLFVQQQQQQQQHLAPPTIHQSLPGNRCRISGGNFRIARSKEWAGGGGTHGPGVGLSTGSSHRP